MDPLAPFNPVLSVLSPQSLALMSASTFSDASLARDSQRFVLSLPQLLVVSKLAVQLLLGHPGLLADDAHLQRGLRLDRSPAAHPGARGWWEGERYVAARKVGPMDEQPLT